MEQRFPVADPPGPFMLTFTQRAVGTLILPLCVCPRLPAPVRRVLGHVSLVYVIHRAPTGVAGLPHHRYFCNFCFTSRRIPLVMRVSAALLLFLALCYDRGPVCLLAAHAQSAVLRRERL